MNILNENWQGNEWQLNVNYITLNNFNYRDIIRKNPSEIEAYNYVLLELDSQREREMCA